MRVRVTPNPTSMWRASKLKPPHQTMNAEREHATRKTKILLIILAQFIGLFVLRVK